MGCFDVELPDYDPTPWPWPMRGGPSIERAAASIAALTAALEAAEQDRECAQADAWYFHQQARQWYTTYARAEDEVARLQVGITTLVDNWDAVEADEYSGRLRALLQEPQP